jgi:hypothetical protein
MRQRAHLQPALREGGALEEVPRDPRGRVIGVLRSRPPLRAQSLQKTTFRAQSLQKTTFQTREFTGKHGRLDWLPDPSKGCPIAWASLLEVSRCIGKLRNLKS